MKTLAKYIFLALFSVGYYDIYPPLNVHLHSNSPAEVETKSELASLTRKFVLAPYTFTRNIEIEQGSKPHSHPTLTLNTRYNGRLIGLLSQYIHEQMHWFLVDGRRTEALKRFVVAMRTRFPESVLPKYESTDEVYVHFAVCKFELDAMTKLIGQERALEVFRESDVYPWVREIVVENQEFIEKNMVASGLSWSDSDLY